MEEKGLWAEYQIELRLWGRHHLEAHLSATILVLDTRQVASERQMHSTIQKNSKLKISL